MENENESIHSVGSFVAHSVVQIIVKHEDYSKLQVKIFDYNMQTADFSFTENLHGLEKPQIYDKIFVISRLTDDGAIICLYEIPKKQIAGFKLPNSKDFAVKLDENYLTINDEFGRVIIFDHKEKVTRRNLRF